MAADKPNCDVVICTPFIHLASVTPIVDAAVIGVGAENCADKVEGAYTGEVSAAMVASTGAKYVILGHSERRAYYGETVEILKEKVKLALANGLTPIFCIGEVLEEREANKQNEVVAAQLASVFELSAEDFAKIILAYELLVQVRLLLLLKHRKFTLSSVRWLLRNMAKKLLITLLFFMVVAASLPMLKNCSQTRMLTVV